MSKIKKLLSAFLSLLIITSVVVIVPTNMVATAATTNFISNGDFETYVSTTKIFTDWTTGSLVEQKTAADVGVSGFGSGSVVHIGKRSIAGETSTAAERLATQLIQNQEVSAGNYTLEFDILVPNTDEGGDKNYNSLCFGVYEYVTTTDVHFNNKLSIPCEISGTWNGDVLNKRETAGTTVTYAHFYPNYKDLDSDGTKEICGYKYFISNKVSETDDKKPAHIVMNFNLEDTTNICFEVYSASDNYRHGYIDNVELSKEVTVIFNNDGMTTKSTGLAGADMELPVLDNKENCTFAGWYTADGTKASDTYPAEDTTYYAKWEYLVNGDFETYSNGFDGWTTGSSITQVDGSTLITDGFGSGNVAYLPIRPDDTSTTPRADVTIAQTKELKAGKYTLTFDVLLKAIGSNNTLCFGVYEYDSSHTVQFNNVTSLDCEISGTWNGAPLKGTTKADTSSSSTYAHFYPQSTKGYRYFLSSYAKTTAAASITVSFELTETTTVCVEFTTSSDTNRQGYIDNVSLVANELYTLVTTSDEAGVFAGGDAGKGNTDIEYKENSAVYEMNGIEYTAFRVYGEYQCPVVDGVADPSKIMVDGEAKELVSRTLYLGNPADGDVIEKPEYTSSTTNLKNVWDCTPNDDGKTATVTYSFLLRDIIVDWKDYAYAVNTSVTYKDGDEEITVNGVQLGGENMTPQKMYESANAQSSLAWFTEAPTE